ncbi:HNH endonuclease [Nitrosomonas europaea]
MADAREHPESAAAPGTASQEHYISTEPENMMLICPHCHTYPHSSV